MTNSRERLIESLIAGPARPRFRGPALAALWMTATAVCVLAATLLIGPVRPGALRSLVTTPQFTLEIALGAVVFVSAARLAFALAVPGIRTRPVQTSTWVLLLAWLGLLALAFVHPAVEPSMLGKREHCALEGVIYGGPTAAAGLWLLSRGYVLRPVAAALALGLAAGVLPATVMQVACMYDPAHAFQYHVAPGILVASAMTIIGAWQARRQAGRR